MSGKTVWITGGKRIGQKVAERLASLGANIIVSYRSSEMEAEELIKQAKKYGRKTLIIKCDVSIRESVIEAVKEIKSKFTNLDILILMASIFKPIKLENILKSDLDDNFGVHAGGTFWPVQACLHLMRPGSHIITVSDRTAIGKMYSGYLPYIVTKGAVASLTKALAAELGPKGVFINSIAPGPVLKPPEISEKEWQEIRENSNIKYPITDREAVEEFVQTVVRLSCVRSSGGIYPLDFGQF